VKGNSNIIEKTPNLYSVIGLAFLFVFFNHIMVISSSWNTEIGGSGKIGV
jgi:hypothetical protein